MIAFPTTAEAFIANQEELVGRKLSEWEREVTAAWIEAFNLSYEDGLNQDSVALERDLSKLDEFMARHKDNNAVHKFAEACRVWIMGAWRQGKEAVQYDERGTPPAGGASPPGAGEGGTA